MMGESVKYFRYHNTNCFFLKSARNDDLLAIDAGWPCTLYEYQRAMKSIDCSFKNIKWAIVTHFHMDHAGLIGEFIKEGITCFILENQTLHDVGEMEKIILKNREYATYQKIDTNKLTTISLNDVNKKLSSVGIDAEFIITQGHSPDSISCLTKNHEAIIGDLAPINQIMDTDTVSIENWNTLKQSGITHIYPSHADIFDL